MDGPSYHPFEKSGGGDGLIPIIDILIIRVYYLTGILSA